MNKVLFLTLCLLTACGDRSVQEVERIVDGEPGEVTVVHYNAMRNRNSFAEDGYIYMTTTPLVDSEYHRWETFYVELPNSVEVFSQDGAISARLIIHNYVANCIYEYNGVEFVKQSCEDDYWEVLTVTSCMQVSIDGVRNFTVAIKFKEVL